MYNEHIMTRVADVGAGTIAVASLAGILPHIASALTIVWMAIRIYETRTVQRGLTGEEPKRGGEE